MLGCIYRVWTFTSFTAISGSWDHGKAAINLSKHGVSFETACAVFLYPSAETEVQDTGEEVRLRTIGYTPTGRLLLVVHLELVEGSIRMISAWRASPKERRAYEND